MTRSGAAIITNMLEAVIKEGTGRQAAFLPGPLAGKTGTTNGFKDAMFIGYSPGIAAGVWVGNDDATSLGPDETGARAALPLWMEFMREALAEEPQRYFDIPEDIVQIYIDPRTGDRLASGTKDAVRVMVKSGG
jgi:penicillin-binding protein 1A